MKHLSNQVYVSIKIQDRVLYLGGGQLLSLVITENCNQFLPTLEMRFVDKQGTLFTDPIVHDNVRLSVSLAVNNKDTNSDWRDFQVSVKEIISTRTENVIFLTGLLHCPEYMYESMYKSYRSSTSNIARQIAQDCTLTADVDDTNDDQAWINYGMTRAKFLKHVSTKAWKDPQSAYIVCVTRDRILKYCDITTRRNQAPKFTFQVMSSSKLVDTNKDIIYVSEADYKVEFNNNIFNFAGGYGLSQRSFDYLSGAEKFLSPDDYKPHTTFLMQNADLKGNRFLYGSDDMGNLHKNYNLAMVQNIKNKSLYSTSLIVTCPASQIIGNLLDRVQFIYFEKTRGTIGNILDGIYFIGRITHTIEGATYITKYELVREGINSSNRGLQLKQ